MVVLVLGMGPLAAAEVTVSSREPLLLQVGERQLELRIEPGSISGAGLQLRRVDGGLSGTLEGQPVELRWDETGDITGQAVGQSVDLTAVPLAAQSGLKLSGWFGGETAELALTPTALSGSVGGCGYSLSLAANRYSGWRTCEATRGPPVSVTLRIPESLGPLGAAEEGALLALLLSAESLPPASSPGAGTPSP